MLMQAPLPDSGNPFPLSAWPRCHAPSCWPAQWPRACAASSPSCGRAKSPRAGPFGTPIGPRPFPAARCGRTHKGVRTQCVDQLSALIDQLFSGAVFGSTKRIVGRCAASTIASASAASFFCRFTNALTYRGAISFGCWPSWAISRAQ